MAKKPKLPNKKISFGDGENIFNESAMSFPERNPHTGLPSTKECLNMSEEEVAKLKGRAKSKATIVRAAAKRKGQVSNPGGNNQWTKENAIKKYREEAVIDTLQKLKDSTPHAIDVINSILQGGTELNKLRAAEILIAYQIAKPVYKEKDDDSAPKTFIVLPPETIIDEKNIVKVERVQNPEKGRDKK